MSQERVDNLFASESWSAVYTAYSNISLKAYDFDTIREALLAYVQQTYPDKFNDFIASSEFIAILDLVAYLGHSLSFRLDMNTRENFLDTAERRESILRMAKNLGYIKTRPINARGYMKITSVTTNQDVTDNEGNSLANTTVNWNDANNADWYENFITILDSSFSNNSKVQDPTATLNFLGIENNIYEINENPLTKRFNYPFTAEIAGSSRKFETTKVEISDDIIGEAEPNVSKKFTIINRNDNLGPASDRTGFFVYAKAGEMNFSDYTYDLKLSNRTQNIDVIDISNTDVWIQRTDSNRNYISSVTTVDNDSRETAIYNSLRTGSGDLASVTTNIDNSIAINFPDGIFGNAAYGNYRIWYRQTSNENFTVNANDIAEVSITVPYIGGDNRPYDLTLTMTTTSDFSENYAAETFESVRRIAPRAYYSQDRMVNAQDYNIYPLTLGSNVISKMKAVNTTFAGKSRFFEMDDVTGNHSNLSATGTDGSVFLEDDIITMNISFNRQNGQIDNFIRNKITEVLKHPSLMNLYYFENMYNPASTILTPNLNFTVRSTNASIIDTVSSTSLGTVYMYPGDHILTQGAYEKELSWTKIRNIESSVVGSAVDSYFIENILPETTGSIEKIVRAYRTRFEADEIKNIKTNKIEDLSVQSFIIKYVPKSNTSVWEWKLHDEVNDVALVEGKDIYISFTYVPGVRENEAEYVATFTGKKIVFDSKKQVKFFYNNDKLVVDNETNLAERDKLFLKYYTTIANDSSNGLNELINIGTAQVSNVVTPGDNTVTFDADFADTGAVITHNFVNNTSAYTVTSTQHKLISPLGVEYPISPIAPSSDTVIGDTPDYTVSYDKDGLSELLVLNDYDDNHAVEDSDEYVYSSTVVTIDDSGNVAEGFTYTTTYTQNDFELEGFKGNLTNAYFDLASPNNFAWVDSSELPAGKTIDTAIAGDTGVQTEFGRSYDGVNYEFTFTDMTANGWSIRNHNLTGDDPDNPDNDVYWKQFAFGEINFPAANININNLILTDINNNQISLDDCEVTQNNGSYTIIFWTVDPGIGNNINVRSIGGSAVFTDFLVRVERSISPIGSDRLESYSDVESYVYDSYITPAGYVDYTKVKLTSTDIDRNPHGMLQVFTNLDNVDNAELGDVSEVEFSHIVLEQYTDSDNIVYERVSDRIVATNQAQSDRIPETAIIRFYIESDDLDINEGEWQRRSGSGWVPLPTDQYTLVNSPAKDKIIYAGNQYRVVIGRSYVEDKFMTFRWDHYADIDKRIDPSTSNIIDMYILGTDYVRRVNAWIDGGFSDIVPLAPNNFELTKIMESINPKASISDHISYIPVKFKYLFGSFAASENQAVFKVVKKEGTSYSDSEIKTSVANAVNTFFDIDNWDFGETFYFSELASYIHKSLPNHISSVVITPKYQTSEFTNLLSISSEPTEIFLSITTSKDVKIISSIVASELLGE
jgi:hypothetical protein